MRRLLPKRNDAPHGTYSIIKDRSAWQTDKALKNRCSMIAYNPTGQGDCPRGWYVREYHSSFAMEQHLKGKKGWEASYAETGPFRTENEAREYATGFTH
jgi:hypothetical protein